MASIKKRNDSYQIIVSLGYDLQGKQIVKYKTWKPSQGMSKKEIKDELNRQVVKFEEDCKNLTHTTNMKFEEFTKKIWFPEFAERKHAPQTLRSEHFLERRIYNHLGYIRLDKFTTRDIQKFVNTLSEETRNDKLGKKGKKLSPKTIKEHISMISNIFRYAIKQGFAKENPCTNVELPKSEKKKIVMLSQEEAQGMLDLFTKEKIQNLKYVLFFTNALKTGLRRGEILGLEWKDINFENCLLSVERDSLYTKELGTYTGKGKTISSIRILPVEDNLIDILKIYKAYQYKYISNYGSEYHDFDRQFTKNNGEPMGVSSPNDFMIEFCKRTGLKKVSIHSFRHLNASTLIAKGFDPKVVQDFLGHRQSETTMNIYAHAFAERKAKMARGMLDGYKVNVSAWNDKVQKEA